MFLVGFAFTSKAVQEPGVENGLTQDFPCTKIMRTWQAKSAQTEFFVCPCVRVCVQEPTRLYPH